MLSTSITRDYFKKAHLLPLSPPDEYTNHQAYLAATQISKFRKVDEIESIVKTRIAPREMEEIRTTDPMVILRENGRVNSSRNLLLTAATYNTIRTGTVLLIQEIKTVERDIKCRRMVSTTKTPGDYDGYRQKPDSLPGIYMAVVVEAQCRIVTTNLRKKDKVKQNSV